MDEKSNKNGSAVAESIEAVRRESVVGTGSRSATPISLTNTFQAHRGSPFEMPANSSLRDNFMGALLANPDLAPLIAVKENFRVAAVGEKKRQEDITTRLVMMQTAGTSESLLTSVWNVIGKSFEGAIDKLKSYKNELLQKSAALLREENSIRDSLLGEAKKHGVESETHSLLKNRTPIRTQIQMPDSEIFTARVNDAALVLAELENAKPPVPMTPDMHVIFADDKGPYTRENGQRIKFEGIVENPVPLPATINSANPEATMFDDQMTALSKIAPRADIVAAVKTARQDIARQDIAANAPALDVNGALLLLDKIGHESAGINADLAKNLEDLETRINAGDVVKDPAFHDAMEPLFKNNDGQIVATVTHKELSKAVEQYISGGSVPADKVSGVTREIIAEIERSGIQITRAPDAAPSISRSFAHELDGDKERRLPFDKAAAPAAVQPEAAANTGSKAPKPDHTGPENEIR